MFMLAMQNRERGVKIHFLRCSARREACYVVFECPPKLVRDPSETRQPVKD